MILCGQASTIPYRIDGDSWCFNSRLLRKMRLNRSNKFRIIERRCINSNVFYRNPSAATTSSRVIRLHSDDPSPDPDIHVLNDIKVLSLVGCCYHNIDGLWGASNGLDFIGIPGYKCLNPFLAGGRKQHKPSDRLNRNPKYFASDIENIDQSQRIHAKRYVFAEAQFALPD